MKTTVDEIDNDNLIETTIRNLGKNRIHARSFESIADFYNYINITLKKKSTIGSGDSKTLEDIGFYDYLSSGDFVFLDKYKEGLSKVEKRKLYLGNFNSDYFFSGINAVTTSGEIYNLDGNGTRVAPIIYGPRKVFLVCGYNKIVGSKEEAEMRVKNIAAPLDAKRLKKSTPCVKAGRCMECKSPEKICNYWTVIQGQFDENRIEVLFLNKKMGF